VVDIHSHILPEVDEDRNLDVSIAMCRTAAADGITHQVATPHANDAITTIAHICKDFSRICKG